jgi:hypothetical protein
MSTLNVANISDDKSTLSNSANPSDVLNNTTTVDTKFVTNGCAKAYSAFDTTSTPISVYSSLNVSTHTDIQIGQTDLNITSIFADSDYVSSADCLAQSTAATYRGGINSFGCTTSKVDYRCGRDTGYVDSAYNSIVIHGDLA